MEAAGPLTIEFLDEGSKDPDAMRLAPALARSVHWAAALSVGKDAFSISFHSLLIGLIAAPDATGAWLRAQFERTQSDLEGVLERRGLGRDDLRTMLDTEPPGRGVLPAQPFSRTASGRQALHETQRLAQAAARPPDTADLLTAMLGLPGFHDSDFRARGIDRGAWAADFAAQQARGTPPETAPASDLDLKTAEIERQVREALRLAHGLAASAPIAARHVLAAVWTLAAQLNSPAFTRFAQILPPPDQLDKASPGPLPDPAQLDPALRRQLAHAQRPAGQTRAEALWGRDLITAVLLCEDEPLRADLAARHLDLDAARDRWYAFVTQDAQRRTPAQWAAWWRFAGVALPGPRRAGYARETDEGEDKLGVDVEAEAFARLILDKAVEPPLSIGLLGDWGSGKSFFIQQIRRSIQDLRSQQRPELHARVVEIEFNAWHASDANLWASLVTNIFDEIWRHVSPAGEKGDLQAARVRLRQQIEQARGAVHEAETQVQLGQQALELAERELQHKRELLAWSKVVTSISRQQLQALMKDAGWHPAIETINDVEDSARALAASGNQLRTLGTALLERPVWGIAMPAMAMLTLTALVWLLVARLPEVAAQVSKALTAVAGTVAALIAPLKLARDKIERLNGALKDIKHQYDQQLASSTDPVQAEAITRARRELKSAEASVAAARTRLAELLNQQASLDPTRRLGAFLQERVQSTQYRSQQGLISLVHKDFCELSKYMKDLREASAEADAAAPVDADAIRPFDRIVLYVDDLDRCRPAHVVHMLEAVHLLLALDLFVVVVAVDSRWLTRALEVHYRELLGGGEPDTDGLRASTPQSYLEKIFQITYALAPMKPERFGDYVASLAGGAPRPPARSTSEAREMGSSTASQGTAIQAGNTEADTSTLTGSSANARGTTPASQPTREQPAQEPAPRRPGSPPVHIGEEERVFIVRLVPLLPTPRIAKRFVNVYRVIKAQKSLAQLESFEQEGRAETCLLMLAILFGRPTVADELLRALHEERPPFDQPDRGLVAALRAGSANPEDPTARHQQLRDWATLADTLQAMDITQTVQACAAQTDEVARYSLVTGHDWHTWTRPRH